MQVFTDSNFKITSKLSTELVLSLRFNNIFNFKAVQIQIYLTINRTNGFKKNPLTITTTIPPTMITISVDYFNAG